MHLGNTDFKVINISVQSVVNELNDRECCNFR